MKDIIKKIQASNLIIQNKIGNGLLVNWNAKLNKLLGAKKQFLVIIFINSKT